LPFPAIETIGCCLPNPIGARVGKRGCLDIATAGLLFESLTVHDIRAYAEACDATAFHYRSHDSRDEVDCILETASGEWAGFEVTLGSDSAIDELC
jgi:hypothetical protein